MKAQRNAFLLLALALPCADAASITLSAFAGGTGETPCNSASACSNSGSGVLGGGQFTSSADASVSANYGAMHASSDATLVILTAPTVVNGFASTGRTSISSTDTFFPSVASGTLVYEFSLDGILSQNTPGCGNCLAFAEVDITATDANGEHLFGPGENDLTVFSPEGNLGAISEQQTVEIPYTTSGDVGVTITLSFLTGPEISAFPVDTSDYTASARFQDTLSLAVGILGQPNASLNPTSGFQYTGITPEPSTMAELLVGLGVALAAHLRRRR